MRYNGDMSKEMFFVIFTEKKMQNEPFPSENTDADDCLYHYKSRINYQNGASESGGMREYVFFSINNLE